jgi:hypothetical protein
MTDIAPDPDKLKLYSLQLFTKLEGAITAGLVHLGDRLGLYQAMADAPGPVTSAELAERSGLDERWIREWLHNQAAARLIAFEDERFWLEPEAKAVLATPSHPAFGMGLFHRLPQTMATLEHLPGEFRARPGIGDRRHTPLSLEDLERQHIERTLKHHTGNRTRAAIELGISRATLINKIKRYSLTS